MSGCLSAQFRELIMENISYDVLLVDLPYDKEIVEEILELIVLFIVIVLFLDCSWYLLVPTNFVRML